MAEPRPPLSRVLTPTWVDGIGPPLEQIACDYQSRAPAQTRDDVLALIRRIHELEGKDHDEQMEVFGER